MTHSEHVSLQRSQATALPLREGDVIHVANGSVWLTLQGHSRDVWLHAHQTWQVPHTSQVWLSTDVSATLTVVRPVAPTRRIQRKLSSFWRLWLPKLAPING